MYSFLSSMPSSFAIVLRSNFLFRNHIITSAWATSSSNLFVSIVLWERIRSGGRIVQVSLDPVEAKEKWEPVHARSSKRRTAVSQTNRSVFLGTTKTP